MNSFVFNLEYFLQVQGTAIGTRMTPYYANLFIGKLELEFLQTEDIEPLVWWRLKMTFLPSGPMENKHYATSLRALIVITPPSNLLVPDQLNK